MLKEGNGPEIEATFYLEHQPWNGGSFVAVLPPRATEARFIWRYGEDVNIRFDFYNIAGELIWQGRATGPSGDVRYGLVSASGAPIASGVYLLKVQTSSLDGSVDDIRIVKLVVLR